MHNENNYNQNSQFFDDNRRAKKAPIVVEKSMRLSRRELLIAGGGVAVGLVTGSCGGGSGGSSRATATLGQGSVAGYVYTKAGSAPLLGYTSTPPAGYTPSSAASISISGKSNPIFAQPNGSFEISKVPAGPQVLSVTVGGTTTKFPLTVFNGVTIQVGDPPVTRDQALAASQAQATGSGLILDSAQILMPQQPVPSGSSVAPFFSFGDPNAADITAINSPQWLVYIDLCPVARFGHPTAYVFVDAVTAAVSLIQADSWPTVNGCRYYSLNETNLTSPDLVQPTSKAIRPHASSTKTLPRQAAAERSVPKPTLRDVLPGCTGGNVHALIIRGDSRSDFAGDPPHIRSLFGRGPFPAAANIVEIDTFKTINPLQAIIDSFNSLCNEVSSCDILVLYVTSHAGAISGQMAYGIQLEVTPGSLLPDGTFIAETDAYLSPTMLDFTQCKACQIVVIIDTCHAGLFIDLTTNQLSGLPGKEIVVMAACATSELATGIDSFLDDHTSLVLNGTTINAPDGGLFTDGLVYAFNQGQLPTDLYGGLASAFNTATAYVTAFQQTQAQFYRGRLNATSQTPELWQRTLIDGEVCGGGSVTSTIN